MIHCCISPFFNTYLISLFMTSVPAFIFLSGYLTNPDKGDWAETCRHRIVKVLVPYVVWTVIYTLRSHGTWLKLADNLVLARACAPMYFVLVYIQLMLITPWLMKIARSKYKWVVWTIAPAYLLLLYGLELAFGIVIPKPVALVMRVLVIAYIPYYYLGLLLGNNLLRVRTRTIYLVVAAMVLQLLCIAENFAIGHFGLQSYCSTPQLSSIPLNLTISLLAHRYITSQREAKPMKLIVTIGDLSFGIYLTHIFFMQLISTYSPIWFDTPRAVNGILIIAVTTAFVWLLRKLSGKKISGWLGV